MQKQNLGADFLVRNLFFGELFVFRDQLRFWPVSGCLGPGTRSNNCQGWVALVTDLSSHASRKATMLGWSTRHNLERFDQFFGVLVQGGLHTFPLGCPNTLVGSQWLIVLCPFLRLSISVYTYQVLWAGTCLFWMLLQAVFITHFVGFLKNVPLHWHWLTTEGRLQLLLHVTWYWRRWDKCDVVVVFFLLLLLLLFLL